jgi:cytochrome P450 family 6
MYKFTTDSIASCAFGVNSNSLKNPDSEFRSYMRGIVGGSVRASLAFLAGFCAPYLSYLLKLQIVTDSTADYIRKIVWSTVEYR